MRPDELAARSLDEREANDRAVLTVLAAAGDVGVPPGAELASRAGLAARTATRALARLIDAGLAARDGKRRAWATDAGRSEAGAGTPGLSLAPTLDLALACFPAEALRAFARLQLAAVPARWHLAREHTSGWPGFIALGPSKTGKTSVAAFVCRVYGLDAIATIRLARDETPGSLFARRVKDADSPTGYRVQRSPLLELPYACVDEWDKAPVAVRQAAGGLLHGATAAELEGDRIRIAPTVYVALNTRREGLAALHEAHVRRSVVLDTTELRRLLADIDEHMERLFARRQVAVPRLSLDRLRPPAAELPVQVRAVLRSALRAGLTEEGWSLTDVEPLARIALGRAALTSGSLEQAALATALDYLTCAATLGHALPGFASQLARQLGARGPLVPDPAAAEAQLEHKRQAERAADRQAAADRLRFEAERERRAGQLLAARDTMGRKRDVERQALARALTSAARDLRGARTAEALDSGWYAAAPYLEQAQRWTAAQEAAAAEQRQLDDQHRRHRESEKDARRTERKQLERAERERKAHRRQLAAELRSLRAELGKLERLAERKTTRPDERPLELLRELRILGGHPVLTFTRDQRPDGLLERLIYAGGALSGTTGHWTSPWDSTLMLSGSESDCDQLASWQAPATRRALMAALEPLRAREVQLAAQVGPPPRRVAAAPRTPARGKPRAARARPSRGRRAARPSRPAPRKPERARCPGCGTVYKRLPLLGLADWCTRCKRRLEPL